MCMEADRLGAADCVKCHKPMQQVDYGRILRCCDCRVEIVKFAVTTEDWRKIDRMWVKAVKDFDDGREVIYAPISKAAFDRLFGQVFDD